MAACNKCLTNRAIGRVNGKALPGTMSEVCLKCATDMIRVGTCPMCQSGFDTVDHIECLTGGVTPIVEPART